MPLARPPLGFFVDFRKQQTEFRRLSRLLVAPSLCEECKRGGQNRVEPISPECGRSWGYLSKSQCRARGVVRGQGSGIMSEVNDLRELLRTVVADGDFGVTFRTRARQPRVPADRFFEPRP